MYKQRPLSVSLRKAQTGLNLPSFFELTRKDVERVGGMVTDLLKRVG
jgi:perosamine synthetase